MIPQRQVSQSAILNVRKHLDSKSSSEGVVLRYAPCTPLRQVHTRATHIIRFAVIAFIVAALAPAVAIAEKRIAVSSFRGDESAAAKIERDVRKILARDARIVSKSSKRIDGLVYGTITRRRANFYVLHLLVVDKSSGERFKELVLNLEEPRLRGDARRKVAKGLRARVGKIDKTNEDRKGKAKKTDDDGDLREDELDEEKLDEDELAEDDSKDELDEDELAEDELDEEKLDQEGDDDEGDEDELDEESLDEDDEGAEKADKLDEDFPGEGTEASGSRFSDIPMELIAGTDIIERTLFGDGGTELADLFARGDVYPFAGRKNILRHLGVVLEATRPFGADAPADGMEGMEPPPGPPTEVLLGAATRYRFKRNVFVVLAKAEAGVNLAMAGGENDVGPLLRGTVAVGAEVKTFLFLVEAANFETNGDASQLNALPNLIIDWRLRHGGIHPFAIAVLPLRKEVRENVPLIIQIGLRYEQ